MAVQTAFSARPIYSEYNFLSVEKYPWLLQIASITIYRVDGPAGCVERFP
jgi:hypothetical protein